MAQKVLLAYRNDSVMDNCTSVLKIKNQNLDIFSLVLLSSILIVGTLFNSFAMWVFCCKMKKWTETRVFMMSLLASDCCLLFTIPFRIYDIQTKWDLGITTCTLAKAIYFMNTYMSIAVITLISVDRYIAIKFPLKARSLRSPTKAAMSCGFVWTLLFLSHIYIVITLNPLTNDISCFQKPTREPFTLSLYFPVLGYCIPLLIVTFCSVEIIRTLKKKDKLSTHEQKSIQKTMYIVSCNLVIFLLCFSPYVIGNIVRYTIESSNLDCSYVKTINQFVEGAQPIADLNCCLDAASYYFVAREFWEITSLSPKINMLQQTPNQTQDSSL
ncbi:G-protein coupled receptor 35-like [Pelodytes ibericus]